MPLEQLDEKSKFYQQLKCLFYSEWRHSDTSAQIQSIYIKKNSKNPRYQIRFHGTQRACYEGSSGSTWKPCSNSKCHVCSILRNGFSIRKSSPRTMFGPAIYTTIVSSKANLYARNDSISSHKHAIIICGVYLGNCAAVRCPGFYHQFDSVEALTKDKGGAVTHPETIIYKEQNVVPLGVIVYTRKGWRP